MSRPLNQKPVRRNEVKRVGFPRVPYSEPLTPGLRKIARAEAIGFVSDLSTEYRIPIDGRGIKINSQRGKD